MGPQFYPCRNKNCGETYCDCSDYYECCSCHRRFCTRCEFVEKISALCDGSCSGGEDEECTSESPYDCDCEDVCKDKHTVCKDCLKEEEVTESEKNPELRPVDDEELIKCLVKDSQFKSVSEARNYYQERKRVKVDQQ